MNNDKLDALFNGLTGAPQPEENTKEQERPILKKPSKQKANKPQEERFCTIVNSETLKKIRLIAAREGLQIKDIVNAAFDKAVKSYERKNGTIDKDTRRDASQLF